MTCHMSAIIVESAFLASCKKEVSVSQLIRIVMMMTF